MNKLDDLLNKLCPDGVEYKTLGELGEFYGGLTGKGKNDFIDGNAKFITYMNVYKNLKLKLDVSEKVKINPGEKQRTLEYGDVIFTGSSETPDECGISSVLADKTDEKLYLNSFCICFRFNDPTIFNPEFSKYLFRSQELRVQIGKTASGVTRFNVSKEKMRKVIVPIIPLEIQNEIVRILDKFTELEEELEEELEARRKQYEYYRDSLFTNCEGSDGTILDMLCQPITDGPHTTPTLVKDGIPFISATAVYDGKIHLKDAKGFISEEFDKECCRKYKPQKNDVFMVKSGSTTGKVAFVDTDERFNIWSPLAAMRTNEKNLPRFLYHLLQTSDIQKQVIEKMSHGSQPNLSMRVLETFSVKIPSLEDQNRIVSILDKLDSICNDIFSGLPAEIEARHKQYEYYRDKLLTFKRKSA